MHHSYCVMGSELSEWILGPSSYQQLALENGSLEADDPFLLGQEAYFQRLLLLVLGRLSFDGTFRSGCMFLPDHPEVFQISGVDPRDIQYS